VVTRLYSNEGSGVFCAVWSVPWLYNESLFVALSSGVPENQENGYTAEYNGDEKIRIGSSEVVQQSTRMRIESVVGVK
jgi:hypothetical protein